MKNFLQIMKRPLIITGVVILLDQIIKIWIKTSFLYNEQVPLIGDYFKLFFIENNGMAFGMELGGDFGKLFLSLFRVFAVGGIFYYIYKLSKDKASPYLIFSMSLILAGALGNIIDSIFYGKIFSLSTDTQVATMLPPEGGYAGWMHGQVVDMFYFTGRWPEWVPSIGGDMIFPPIWNLADASITIGVILIALFYRKIFAKPRTKEENQTGNDVISTT